MLTTELALQAIAWERAPRHPGRTINRRVVCADGFTASVQASESHYANDSHPDGGAPYWGDRPVCYPFTTVEIGNPIGADMSELAEWDSGGVWAWVPVAAVAAFLDAHGGVTHWEGDPDPSRAPAAHRLCGPNL